MQNPQALAKRLMCLSTSGPSRVSSQCQCYSQKLVNYPSEEEFSGSRSKWTSRTPSYPTVYLEAPCDLAKWEKELSLAGHQSLINTKPGPIFSLITQLLNIYNQKLCRIKLSEKTLHRENNIPLANPYFYPQGKSATSCFRNGLWDSLLY